MDLSVANWFATRIARSSTLEKESLEHVLAGMQKAFLFICSLKIMIDK